MRTTETAIAFWAIFIVTVVGCAILLLTDVAEATDYTTYNVSDNNPFSNYQFPGSFDYVHTKDDYLVIPYVNSDGDLMVAYRGTSEYFWENETVAEYNWGGHAGPWYAWGVVSTSNNSIVIGAAVVHTATYMDRVYIWTKFPADDWDDWDPELVMTGSWYYTGDISINDTDIILIGGKWGSSSPYDIKYETFDFDAYSLGHGVGTGHSMGISTSQCVGSMANHSGVFHWVFRGSDNKMYYTDLTKSIGLIALSASTAYYFYDFWIMPNDLFFFAGLWTTGSTIAVGFQTAFESAPTIVIASVASGTWRGVTCSPMKNETSMHVIGYLNGDRGYHYQAQWNGSASSWQNSEVDADVYDADNYIWISGGCKHLWPQDEEGRMWGMPTAGWQFVGRDEDGVEDEYRLYTNGTTFWGDLTTAAPEITTTSIPTSTYGEYYSYTLTKTGGTGPFVWSLLIGPSWMSINSTTGELYGTADATGSATVRVRLADAIPRYDEVQWSMGQNPATSSTFDSEGWLWWGDVSCISTVSILVCVLLVFVVFLQANSRR